MGRIRELRRSQRRTSSLYDTFFTRQISVFVTALLLPTGISPNAVSFLNLVMGLTAWALIGFDMAPLAGVFLVHMYAVLDSVDGELARHTGRFSLQGMFLEDYSAYLMIAGYWISMGAVLERAYESSVPLAAAIVLVAFGRSAMPVARRVTLLALTSQRWMSPDRLAVATDPHAPALIAGADGTRLSGFPRLVFQKVLHPSHVWAVTTLVYAVETVWLGRAYVLGAVVGLYYFLSWLKELAVVASMGWGASLEEDVRRYDGEHSEAKATAAGDSGDASEGRR